MIMGSSTVTSTLPMRPIPGSYGLPLVGPLRDRLDYFWFQGPDAFFRSRLASHRSTVFRTNMPPTFPFFVGVDPRVVALLDCASFPVLFEPSLVDKTDVLVGPYRPSLDFTGGTRVAVYSDPSDPAHAPVKAFCFDLLRRSSRVWASEFLSGFRALLSAAESEVYREGKSGLVVPLQKCIFSFLCKSLVGADPEKSSTNIGDGGFAMLDKWLALQLLPTVQVGAIPQPLQELLLHSFPFPFALVKGDYEKLYRFVEADGQEAVQLAEKEYGLSKQAAIHNILFVLGFNAFGGFSVFLPTLLAKLGEKDNSALRGKLKAEVRRVLGGGRRLGFDTEREMELVRSTVYEALRWTPPVPLQYGRARDGFVLSSHDSSYKVEKGELLCGYQPLAMRDPAVFENPEEFREDRFMGVAGKEMLKYLFWSNGPEVGTPTVSNKQCAAKEYVVDTACLMVAEIFDRYEDFECDGSSITRIEKRAVQADMVNVQ